MPARLWFWSVIQDTPPLIKSISRNGGNVDLVWYAVASRSYRVQYKPNLDALTPWTDLPGDVAATTPTAAKTDSSLGNATARYYRVMLVPQ